VVADENRLNLSAARVTLAVKRLDMLSDGLLL
jgi:hypothetical protein